MTVYQIDKHYILTCNLFVWGHKSPLFSLPLPSTSNPPKSPRPPISTPWSNIFSFWLPCSSNSCWCSFRAYVGTLSDIYWYLESKTPCQWKAPVKIGFLLSCRQVLFFLFRPTQNCDQFYFYFFPDRPTQIFWKKIRKPKHIKKQPYTNKPFWWKSGHFGPVM